MLGSRFFMSLLDADKPEKDRDFDKDEETQEFNPADPAQADPAQEQAQQQVQEIAGIEIHGLAPPKKPLPVPPWMQKPRMTMKPPRPSEKFIRDCKGKVQRDCHGDPIKE